VNYVSNTLLDGKNKTINHSNSRSVARESSTIRPKLSARKCNQHSELKHSEINQLTAMYHKTTRYSNIKTGFFTAKHVSNHDSIVMKKKHSNIFNNSIVNNAECLKSGKKYQLQKIIRNAAIKLHKEDFLKSAQLCTLIPHCKTSHETEHSNKKEKSNLNYTIVRAESKKALASSESIKTQASKFRCENETLRRNVDAIKFSSN